MTPTLDLARPAAPDDHAPVPATIVTGFLGAGKTTLVRHLIETAGGRRLALIVNEFGDIGIDGSLLKGCGLADCGDDDIVELANGCLCCTVADDFVPAISRLLARTPRPDHIVIETSGLALPKPLVQAFRWPDLRTRLTVDGVIAVIDAAAVADGRFATDLDRLAAQAADDPALDHARELEELFADQIACADVVVVNKTDLVDRAALAQVMATIAHDTRAGATTVRARHGRIDAATLLGLGRAAEDDLDSRPSHHDGATEEEHGHDEFESFAVPLPVELPAPEALLARLRPLAARPEILRLKGVAAVAGREMRLVIQGVGPRLDHHFDRDWRADEPRQGTLVVIGLKGLDRARIAAAVVG